MLSVLSRLVIWSAHQEVLEMRPCGMPSPGSSRNPAPVGTVSWTVGRTAGAPSSTWWLGTFFRTFHHSARVIASAYWVVPPVTANVAAWKIGECRIAGTLTEPSSCGLSELRLSWNVRSIGISTVGTTVVPGWEGLLPTMKNGYVVPPESNDDAQNGTVEYVDLFSLSRSAAWVAVSPSIRCPGEEGPVP